jgi:F0F1-type ATP synthase assembly protein I
MVTSVGDAFIVGLLVGFCIGVVIVVTLWSNSSEK